MLRKVIPYLPATILFSGCALLWNAHTQDSVPLQGSLQVVLPTMAGYEVVGQTITAEEQSVAGMTDYVARAYVQDGTVAFTTFVSYYDRQTQGRTIHSPRNCLPGAGWEVVSAGVEVVSFNGAPRQLNRYVLKKGSSTALAYYWYQGRGRVTASEYRVKWNLLLDAAMAGRTEEALVRVVVPIQRAATMPQADTTARAISARLMEDLQGILPRQARRS